MSLSARLAPVFLCLVFAAGCAQPVKVAFKPAPLAEKSKAKASVSFFVEPFTDGRGESASQKNPRAIGRITAVVSDYVGPELMISEGVETLASRAFAEELKNYGYALLGAADEGSGADFIVRGVVKRFTLDIGPRDEVDMVIGLEITETETGRIIWQGVATEKGSRFAGVMGNSKATISSYISASLSKALSGAISESAALIENSRAAYSSAVVKDAPSAAPPQGTGRLAITTGEIRAKVYINGVYYGLTPFKTDLEPGVYELVVRHKGFRESKERVSVRRSELTEIEASLEKE